MTAKQVREVAYQLAFVDDAQWARAEYATLRRVIIEWVSMSVSNRKARANLSVVNQRRELKANDPNITPEELPTAPTRYMPVEVG